MENDADATAARVAYCHRVRHRLSAAGDAVLLVAAFDSEKLVQAAFAGRLHEVQKLKERDLARVGGEEAADGTAE